MNTSDIECKQTQDNARRELLLKVYSAALDEVRFNINLAWDRTKFFLLLNSALIAAGIGLLKIGEGTVLISVFLVLFFLLSLSISIFGLQTVAIGKRYYREAVYTKTLVERELGLLEPISGMADVRANLSISVTRGQRNHAAILASRSDDAQPEATPIGFGTTAFLYTNDILDDDPDRGDRCCCRRCLRNDQGDLYSWPMQGTIGYRFYLLQGRRERKFPHR